MFVPVLVRLRLAGQLLSGEMTVRICSRIAAQAILDADLHPGVGEHVLDAGARHRTGREGLTLDDGRILGQHRLNVQRLELASVKGVEISEVAVGRAAKAVAENVLAAGVKAQTLEAEVEKIASRLSALRGLDEQRQPPLALERFPLRHAGKPGPLNSEAGPFKALQKDVVRI